MSEREPPSPGGTVTTLALVLFALSVPLWLAGAALPLQLLPGLPATTPLLVFCLLAAASTLVYRESGAAGVRALLARSFDYARIRSKSWLAPIVLLMPGVMVLSYIVIRVMGVPLPAPQLSVGVALGFSIAFFVAALAEEVGWSGYVIDRMQARWPALQAGILLGVLWGSWHVVPLVQAHRSLTWIAWWFLFTVAGRVLIVWLYNNTGKSVFAAILYHDISNVSVYLFPVYGSHFDLRITGAIVAFVISAIKSPRGCTS